MVITPVKLTEMVPTGTVVPNTGVWSLLGVTITDTRVVPDLVGVPLSVASRVKVKVTGSEVGVSRSTGVSTSNTSPVNLKLPLVSPDIMDKVKVFPVASASVAVT